MCADKTSTFYLAVSYWLAGGGRGKRDWRWYYYHLPWRLLIWRLGWKEFCCCRLLLDLQSILTMLCGVCSFAVSGATWPTMSDLSKSKTRATIVAALFSPAWDTVKLSLQVGSICPFVVIDPTDLGATIVVAQA